MKVIFKTRYLCELNSHTQLYYLGKHLTLRKNGNKINCYVSYITKSLFKDYESLPPFNNINDESHKYTFTYFLKFKHSVNKSCKYTLKKHGTTVYKNNFAQTLYKSELLDYEKELYYTKYDNTINSYTKTNKTNKYIKVSNAIII